MGSQGVSTLDSKYTLMIRRLRRFKDSSVQLVQKV